MRIGKSGCVELNQTHYCIGKFNVALSLCRVLGITLYFSEGFLEAVAEALRRDSGLLLETEVQLVVFCTAIEAQIVFEMLLALIAGQLAIAGQLGREVHPWSVRLLLESKGWRWLEGKVLGRQGYQRQICLALGGHDKTGGGSFSLLLGVRLEGLFLCLPCTVAFTVSFPVVVINSHC